ncbi:MAG: hypothetical protein HOP30_17920 [Cyclobacteriaceae bacterium]|nr:hypothetical protein [Cyclobacteriaceae bacterium]
MKALKLIVLMVALGALFTFSSCGGDGTTPEPVTDQQLTKLSKAWKLTAVTLKGVDKATIYNTTGANQFKLTITGTKGTTTFAYTTTGNPSTSVWKGNSDWKFGTDPLTLIQRDLSLNPPLAMNYTVTSTTLTLTFTFPVGATGYQNQGRAEETEGDWVFTFGL